MYLLKLCFLNFFNKPHVQITKVKKKEILLISFVFFRLIFIFSTSFLLQIFQIESILSSLDDLRNKTRGRMDYKKSIPLF